MYIVAIAWIYVALMMSVAEATNTNGTVLGAVITFVLYGVGPVALVMYILGTPRRRKAMRALEASEQRPHPKTTQVARPEEDRDSSGKAG